MSIMARTAAPTGTISSRTTIKWVNVSAETQGDASEPVREASETARCGYTTGFWHDVRVLSRAAREEVMEPAFALSVSRLDLPRGTYGFPG